MHVLSQPRDTFALLGFCTLLLQQCVSVAIDGSSPLRTVNLPDAGQPNNLTSSDDSMSASSTITLPTQNEDGFKISGTYSTTDKCSGLHHLLSVMRTEFASGDPDQAINPYERAVEEIFQGEQRAILTGSWARGIRRPPSRAVATVIFQRLAGLAEYDWAEAEDSQVDIDVQRHGQDLLRVKLRCKHGVEISDINTGPITFDGWTYPDQVLQAQSLTSILDKAANSITEWIAAHGDGNVENYYFASLQGDGVGYSMQIYNENEDQWPQFPWSTLRQGIQGLREHIAQQGNSFYSCNLNLWFNGVFPPRDIGFINLLDERGFATLQASGNSTLRTTSNYKNGTGSVTEVTT